MCLAGFKEANVQEIAKTAQAKDSVIFSLEGDIKSREEALNKLHRAAEQLSQVSSSHILRIDAALLANKAVHVDLVYICGSLWLQHRPAGSMEQSQSV